MNKTTKKRLKYIKIANDVITIDLHNGFSVIAMKLYNFTTGKYTITLYIKDNTVDVLDLIEKQENVELDGKYQDINVSVLKYVSNLLSDGFFKYYIDRYNHMLQCFDIGNDLLEKERV